MNSRFSRSSRSAGLQLRCARAISVSCFHFRTSQVTLSRTSLANLPTSSRSARSATTDRTQYFDYQPFLLHNLVPRRFQWYIAEGMLSLPTAKWSMVIRFFSGVMASGFAFGCAKDTVEFFNAGIGEVRFPVGEGFLLVIFDYVGPWV